MSYVNQEIAKIYFEMNGFLVKSGARLLILNLKPKEVDPSPGLLLDSLDLPYLERAVVEVKGWHTDKFFPSRLKNSPEIFDFVQPESLRDTKRFFKGEDFKKILIVSHLPNRGEMRKKSIEFLQNKGIDHVLEFDDLLKFLIRKVRPNQNYIDSDLLQLLRLLKCYRLLKSPQLELFK